MDHDLLNNLVTWTIMILVLPLFLVIFAVSCLFMAPVLAIGWALRRLQGDA